MEARRQSVSVPRDCTHDLAGITGSVLLIHGRYDRMLPFEISIVILNHIAESRLVPRNTCGHQSSEQWNRSRQLPIARSPIEAVGFLTLDDLRSRARPSPRARAGSDRPPPTPAGVGGGQADAALFPLAKEKPCRSPG
jgi:hypothetical protein